MIRRELRQIPQAKRKAEQLTPGGDTPRLEVFELVTIERTSDPFHKATSLLLAETINDSGQSEKDKGERCEPDNKI